jgi:5-methyltetrahydropteroyltriglutamate--homocysteine methyltransferase
VYKDIDEFIADVVAIQRRMIAELIEAGCRYVHGCARLHRRVDQVARSHVRAARIGRNLERGIKAGATSSPGSTA